MPSCWDERSPFEALHLLILMISLPFFLGMIILYALVPHYYTDSVHCPTFCEQFSLRAVPINRNRVDSIFQKSINTNNLQKVNSEEELNHLKQDEMCDSKSCENMYPFLIAILSYKYDDDLSEQIFIGTGVLVSRKWALTSSTIVKKYINDLNKIQIRAISSYWSKGGIISDVDKIALADDIARETVAALRLTELLSSLVNFVKLSFVTSYANSVVYSTYGWNANYSLALRLRRKYVSSIKAHVTAFDNDICPEITGPNKFCARPLFSTVYHPCYYEVGFAMLDKHDTLLGIKSGEICRKNQSVHIYHNVLPYAQWIKNITEL